jgi:hypothetical protein
MAPVINYFHLKVVMRTSTKNANRTQRKKVRDWVCCLCSNLNFSFRTHCNRCRVQSKAKNDLDLNRSEGYYEALKPSSDRASTATPSTCSREEPELLRLTGTEQDRFPFKLLIHFSDNDWEGPPFAEPLEPYPLHGLLEALRMPA